MLYPSKLAAVQLAVLLFSISGGAAALPFSDHFELAPPAPAGQLRYLVFDQRDSGGGPTQALLQKVDDAATWATVWAQINAGQTPTPPLPEIDFDRLSVLVGAIGVRNSGGYALTVANVADANGELRVRLAELVPGNCATTDALTYPVVLAVIEKTDKPAVFSVLPAVYDCDGNASPL